MQLPTLRDYQSKLIQDTYQAIREGHRAILLALATGGGKTIVASKFFYDALSKGRRVLFLVSMEALISQTIEKSQMFGIEPGVVKSGYPLNLDRRIQIASIQTLDAWQGKFELDFDILILDECHTTTFYRIARQLIADRPNAIRIGLTATPYRRGLADFYTKIVAGPQPKDLIAQGFLVPPRYFHFPDLDLSKVGLNRNTHDFANRDLAEVMNVLDVVERQFQEYQRLAWSRRTIYFGVNVPHSRFVADYFNENGVPAAYVTGKTPVKECNAIYDRLATGDLRFVSSVSKLAVGFDCPPVSCVFNRPTLSHALAEQMDGRVLRISPETGKTDGIIIDSGNADTLSHGRIDQYHHYEMLSLEDKERQPPPVKTCPHCQTIVNTQVRICPECKNEFPLLPKDIPVGIPDIELEELFSEEEREQFAFFKQQAILSFRQGRRPGAAAYTYKDKFGSHPALWWRRTAIFGTNPTEQDRAAYRSYLMGIAERDDLAINWVEEWMQLEFGYGYQTRLNLSDLVST
jgi:superfamily II DNA or RNA helicase